jgi:hypothetical protein
MKTLFIMDKLDGGLQSNFYWKHPWNLVSFYVPNCETVTEMNIFSLLSIKGGMVYMSPLTPHLTIRSIYFILWFCMGLFWWPKNVGDALMRKLVVVALYAILIWNFIHIYGMDGIICALMTLVPNCNFACVCLCWISLLIKVSKEFSNEEMNQLKQSTKKQTLWSLKYYS